MEADQSVSNAVEAVMNATFQYLDVEESAAAIVDVMDRRSRRDLIKALPRDRCRRIQTVRQAQKVQ